MKVGDYVRFKTLSREIKIGRVIEIIAPDKNSMKKYCVYDLDNNEATVDDYIIKSSPNIIDLIEVGDYVNGSYIYSIVEENKNTGQPRVLFTEEDGVLGSGEIKSIVTKEAFEQMEYRIGE